MAGRLWIKSKRHLAWWVSGHWRWLPSAWWLLRPVGVPEGFAVSNGRIEATEVDIASKIAGRIDTILVKEGQFVREGEALAKWILACCRNSDWKPSRKSKKHKVPLPRAGFAGATPKRNSCVQSLVNQRQAELDSVANVIRVPAHWHERGQFRATVDDDRAAAERAPEPRWNRQKLRFRLLKPLQKRHAPISFRRKLASKPRKPPNGALPQISMTAN